MAYYFDELIVAELKRENGMVLRELYKTHYPMVVHLVCSNSGSEQEAKDIYQESVIAFYEKVRQPDFVLTCKIKTYLYAVCRHLWLKRLAEKKKFGVSINEGESFAGIAEELGDVEDAERKFEFIGQSLAQLGDPCSGIIQDFYIHDLSMEEIRDKYGYTSAENAKNQKYKCLQRLKKIFFSYYDSTK
jgi:RNA polymerase sigma factor (sigma-70 family)